MAQQHATRHLRRHGEALTVRNYVFGVEDDHGDAERVETTDSPYATQGRVEAAEEPETTRDESGTTLDYDVTVYLPESDARGTEESFVGGLNGVGADGPPSRIERDDYGETYRVVRVHRQANGVLAADARVVA
jgi:hypothetical protein